MFKQTCVLLLVLVLISIALAKMDGFIVGGLYAKIHQHAHSAFLNINCASHGTKAKDYICTSSIINQNVLLTAAHCLHGCTHQSLVRIHIGSKNRRKGQALFSIGFVVHEDYSWKTNANDVCLLRTNRLIVLGKTATRVAILKKPPYTEKATVAGWGYIDDVRKLQSDLLKFVSQTVWSQDQCINFFGELPSGTICAANANPTNYAAAGDSGSALIVRGYIQIGLVSYKVPNLGKRVVIYTDVGYFYDWIQYYAKVISCIV